MTRVFTQVFGVVGAILEKNGKFLLVREHSNGTMPDAGKWNQPAGWIDVGENPIHGAAREVLEETGYEFEPTHLLGIYSIVREDVKEKRDGQIPHGLKLIFIGTIKNHNDPAKFTDEIEETRWFTPAEIFAMDRKTLRDDDIKTEIQDYLSGKKYPLEAIHHYVQK